MCFVRAIIILITNVRPPFDVFSRWLSVFFANERHDT